MDADHSVPRRDSAQDRRRVRAAPLTGQQENGEKQQMRWTPSGAHLLLQIRTRVLNDELAEDFRRWYPAFVAPSPSSAPELAA
jgi:hypothetical protein